MTIYYVYLCNRCGNRESYSVKDPANATSHYCNTCGQETDGTWFPDGDPDKDWRLQGQEDYLTGITLVQLPYERWSESWEHDHCEFCWAMFMPAGVDAGETEHAGQPIQREGYTNENAEGQQDHYWWICHDCVSDFKDRFGWKIIDR